MYKPLKTAEYFAEKSLSGSFSREDGIKVLEYNGPIMDLIVQAHRVKLSFSGNKVYFCSIVNAKSGLCDAGCIFCAQAYPKTTGAPVYPLIDESEVIKAAELAKKNGASRFSIVTSGRTPSNRDLERIGMMVKKVKEKLSIAVDVSIGAVSFEQAEFLRECGVSMFHHNLESSRNFYRKITNRINWDDRYKFVKGLKDRGFRVCCGGLFGLGESSEDIVDLAFTLKELSPDSIPINFLIPVEGTPLEGASYLTPIKCLKILCLFRFAMPRTAIRVCGGKEYNLRDLIVFVPLIADGMMVGGYLTRPGRDPAFDIRMCEDLGLEIAADTS